MPTNTEVPTFYIRSPVENLALPSSGQLVTTAIKELKLHFAREELKVPEPPQDLFETLRSFAERGIKGFDEVYYQPCLQLTENHEFWKGRGVVKPQSFFWRQIEDRYFSPEAAILQEGWYIGDSRVKPMYNNGKQRYGKDDYLEPLMEYLRASDRIRICPWTPHYSRAGVSPKEIEEVILPEFAKMSGAKGNVRNRRFMEFNVRGNIRHPEYGQTDTWEWFGDPVFGGAYRLRGGGSNIGGLGGVGNDAVDHYRGRTSFSPVVEFPSKPR